MIAMRRTALALSTLAAVAHTGCATFGQKPQPVGEPGPVACIGAQSAILSWEELDKYMRAVLEAQQAYSCGPLAPAALGPTTPVVPALR